MSYWGFGEVSINLKYLNFFWIFRFLAKAQNDKVGAFCHTERSEVSTQNTDNGLLNTEFMDFSLVSLTQNDNV